MATIEELEHQAAHVERMEALAIRSLVDHIREVAVALPPGSNLARMLAVAVGTLEPWATPEDAYPAGATSVLLLAQRIDDQQQEQWGEEED